VRLMITSDQPEVLLSDSYRRVYSAAADGEVPVFVVGVGPDATRYLRTVAEIVGDHPTVVFVIDHLGIVGLTDQRLAPETAITDLVHLAQFPNVAVKCSAATQISREPYPFKDLWPHLHRVLEAFGPERVMWAAT
jgi:L-fuconolactonase